MVDYQALNDAESLLSQAQELLDQVRREIAAMEAAVGNAVESIARAEAAARNGCDHVAWLGAELASGREQQAATLLRLRALDRAERGLREQVLAWQLVPSAVVVGEVDGSRTDALRSLAAVLPTFEPLTQTRLETFVPRPLQAELSTWDLFAEAEVPFTERLKETLALLNEAEAMIEGRLSGATPAQIAGPKARERAATEPAKSS